MINVPAGTRILLATRPIDFRNYAESVRGAAIEAAVYLDELNTPLDIITMPPPLTASAEDAYVEFDHNAYKPFFVS